MQIKIQSLTFDVSEPYQEGHVLTAEEAQALNRCRADNINDRFTRKIKPLLEEGCDFATEQKIRKLYTEFLLEYTFPPGVVKRKIKDPLRELALTYAKEALRAESIIQGIDWDSLLDVVKNERAEKMLALNPEYLDRAGKELDKGRALLAQTLATDLFT